MAIVMQRNAGPLDAIEAARVVGMDSRTLVRWARRGYVPAHPLGEGKRRI
jgi:predicted site-specific integrase-resolvase